MLARDWLSPLGVRVSGDGDPAGKHGRDSFARCSRNRTLEPSITAGEAYGRRGFVGMRGRQQLAIFLSVGLAISAVTLGLALTRPTAAVATPPPPPPRPAPSGPIKITAGGTFSGDWISTDSTPAVLISTSEPVTIVNSTVTNLSADVPLIEVPAGTQADVTLDHVTGHGGVGRFLRAEGFKSVTIRNCTLDKTGGIDLRSPVASASVTVTRNRARNIQKGAGYRQFLQLNRVTTATVEVSWNEVINVYGQSAIEDGISVYKSSNVVIHDNYLQGGYPARFTDPYTGAGIVLSDDGGNFNRAYDNQIVDWTNVGLGIVAGHDNSLTNNRVISDGKLGGSTSLAAANVGIAVWNAYRDPTFANNRARDNVVAWVHARGHRNDMWFPHAPSDAKANIKLRTQVTNSTELNEYKRWVAKRATRGIQIGGEAEPSSLALGQSQSRRNPLFHRTHRAAALHLCLYYYNARRAYSSLGGRPRSAVSSLLWGMTPNRDERRFGEGV